MLFKTLEKRLSHLSPTISIVHLPNDPIEENVLINHYTQTFTEHKLYICHTSDLPLLPPDVGASILCVEDKDLKFLSGWNHFCGNLICFSGDLDKLTLMKHVSDAYMSESILHNIQSELYHALYSNAGLQYLVDIASSYLENPVFVNNSSYKMLAMSNKIVIENRTLESQRELGYIHETNLSALSRGGILDQVAETTDIITSTHPDTHDVWLFKSVRIHGINVALIATLAENRPFTDMDYDLLDTLSYVIALEMEKSSFFKDDPGVMHNYFIHDLLDGDISDMQTFERRSRYLGWKLSKYHMLIAIADTDRKIKKESVEWLGKQLRTILPDCRWTVYDGVFVMVLSRNHPLVLNSYEKTALNNLINSNRLYAGMCDPFESPHDAPHHFKQAAIALELALTNTNPHGAYSYSDMIPYYVTRLILESAQERDFAHPAVLILKDYDEKHNGELLHTLHTYIQHGGNPARTTEALCIHRNTLNYRLHKIEELTQIDLDDGNERFRIQLYLNVLSMN